MPIVRDVKNRDAKKVLMLNKKGLIGPARPHRNILDIAKRKPSKNHSKQKKAYDIATKVTSDSYVFVAKRDEDGRPRKSYKDVIRVGLAGLLVLFVFNVAAIGQKVFSIATEVEADAFEGVHSLVEGGRNVIDSNYGGAVQSFESAGYAFVKAQEKVWFLGNQGIINSKQSIGDSAYAMLEAGEHISSSASYFSQGISGLQEIPVLFLENNTAAREGALPAAKVSLTDKLKTSLNLFNHALDEVEAAQEKIKQGGPTFLPSNMKSQYDTLTNQLDGLVDILHEAQRRIPAILAMLGDRYPHRYLVLLQNNTEARPTGGFIGSYLIVDVNDGYITKVEFKDIYDSDGQLHEYIEAPAEIAALTDNWRMRDSNYSPDFPLSAAKAAWFLEKEQGPSVDSVIAINQSILEDLLTITGPIEIDGLESPLTASNYNTVLTYIVESKLEGAASPKAVIERMIPVMQDKIYDKASFKSLLAVIQKSVREKDILAWSKNTDVQQFFEDVGLSGKVTTTASDEDYLNVVTINVGGNKSDMYMESEILHETTIDKNGVVRNLLTYTRRHTWNPDVVLDWKKQIEEFGFTELPEWIQNILGRGNNTSVVKIYIPANSTIDEIAGVDSEAVTEGYDEDLNKKFIYFTLEVAPQNESIIQIRYTLPEALDLSVADEYRLTVQKQAGSLYNTKFKKRIIPDPRIKNYRNYPEEIVFTEGDVIEYETTLTNDQHFASLWGKE